MATKSNVQLKFLNLVTMTTNKNVNKLFLKLIKKVVIRIYIFGNLFRITVVSIAKKFNNQLKF